MKNRLLPMQTQTNKIKTIYLKRVFTFFNASNIFYLPHKYLPTILTVA